jgi:hypothetical protein
MRDQISCRVPRPRILCCLIGFVLLASTTFAYPATVRPGEPVRFIERDQHIPAHPAPGESRVHLRFVSGSAILDLNLNRPRAFHGHFWAASPCSST